MKRLLLILCLISGLCFADTNPYIIGVPSVQIGSCTGEYCAGASTNCSESWDGNDNSKAQDYTWSSFWSATEGGTAIAVKVRFGTGVDTPVLPKIFLYNGDTLVGSGDITPVVDTVVRATLTVEGGQSLDFSTSDGLWFGYSQDGGSGFVAVDLYSGGTGIRRSSDGYYIDSVPSTWTNADGSLSLLIWLEYCK